MPANRTKEAILNRAHTISDTTRLQFLSGGLCDPNDVERLTERLATFLAAGLRAEFKRRRRQPAKPR